MLSMKEQKSVKAFIKRHGVEIVLGASCIACGVVGYKLASKAITEELMKDLCDNAGKCLTGADLDGEILDAVTANIEDCIL